MGHRFCYFLYNQMMDARKYKASIDFSDLAW